MTIQEAILSRSPLPKDGTNTMYDHMFALEMTVVGISGAITVSTNTVGVQVTTSKADIKVKEDIIGTKIAPIIDNITVAANVVDIRIV